MSGRHCIDCRAVDSFLIDYREGNVTCGTCGRVQESRIIDESSEWRNFSKENSARGGDETKRAGSANITMLADQGLCTFISSDGTKDSMLARYGQRSAQSGLDKTLQKALRSFEEYCNVLTLNRNVEEEAMKLFKTISEQRALKGRQHNAVVSACIFLAARASYSSRTIKDIINVTQADHTDTLRCISMIKKVTPSRGCNPAEEYAQQLSVRLKFNPKCQRGAKIIASRAIEKGMLTGKNPMTVAGVSVYMVSCVAQLDIKLPEISRASNKTENTLRNCYKNIFSRRFELLKDIDSSWNLDLLPTL